MLLPASVHDGESSLSTRDLGKHQWDPFALADLMRRGECSHGPVRDRGSKS